MILTRDTTDIQERCGQLCVRMVQFCLAIFTSLTLDLHLNVLGGDAAIISYAKLFVTT